MRLSVRETESLELPPGKTDYIIFDDNITGFGIRLREGGSRTWIYQYRIGSKQRRMVLGSAKSVPLRVARANASLLEAKVKLRGDPAMAKEAARRDADNTFGSLVDQFLESRKSGWRPRNYAEIHRHLKKQAAPLHRIPITAVSQRDVAHLLSDLAKQRGDTTSNRVRTSLCSLFGWVIREGFRLPEGNVASYTNKREERSRDRVLTDGELKAIWTACRDDDYGAILKLLMLTGSRANEIAQLRWNEVHDDHIVLPAERTKNHRTHVVPLSQPASAILAKYRGAERKNVCGRDDSGFSGWSKAKDRFDARTALAPWRVHDLRRTAATRMAEIGVQPHIVEAVLNHVSGHRAGVAGIYNRATYDKEKREALNLWAAHLLALIEGKQPTVVPLKRA
jgi:integrase